MPSSKVTTARSARKSPKGKRSAKRPRPGTLRRAAKAVASFLTDPDYPRKPAGKRSRHRGELIA